MSFGINGPENKPVIREAQSMFNNGGGGNLGYFQQQKKKKEDENENDILELSFGKQEGEDELNADFSLDAIGTKIKNFWLKVNTPKEEKENKEDEPEAKKEFKIDELPKDE